jgi:ubiquinone/menaquinone biosynthesis C-methylase UbiE
MGDPGLQWHPSLYAGSARYYAMGRVGYPTALADALASELALDGSGRLLDVGCGPGNFTLLLAPWFEQATGLDADREMLAQAKQRAAQAGVGSVQWLHLRAEELPAGLGWYRVMSFAQSFHWMDQLQVAGVALRMLQDGGACVHVHAMTHQGVETDTVLPYPRPPRAAINELVERYLGPMIRPTGKGFWPPIRRIAKMRFGVQPASVARSASRFPARSWSAPAIRLWRASSPSQAPHRTCSGYTAQRSNPIFDDCCMMPTPAGSSASRCVKSPRISGESGLS